MQAPDSFTLCYEEVGKWLRMEGAGPHRSRRRRGNICNYRFSIAVCISGTDLSRWRYTTDRYQRANTWQVG